MIDAVRRAVLMGVVAMALAWPTSVNADGSLEYKLAVVDAGGFVSKDDITIARFRSLLRQLSEKYVESPQQIADMSVKAKELLREEGVSEKMLTMMEGLNQVFSTQVPNQRYSEYVSLYIGLRRQGQSHDASINGLRSILQGLGVY